MLFAFEVLNLIWFIRIHEEANESEFQHIFRILNFCIGGNSLNYFSRVLKKFSVKVNYQVLPHSFAFIQLEHILSKFPNDLFDQNPT